MLRLPLWPLVHSYVVFFQFVQFDFEVEASMRDCIFVFKHVVVECLDNIQNNEI